MEDDEIDSIHSYDFRRARLSLALKWILSTAFGPNIPKELQDPLPLKDKDTVAAIYVNTGLVSLLVNSKIYTQACINLFPQLAGTLNSGGGHWSVIEGLSHLGVYVEEDSGAPVTEKELVQTNPFHLTAHVCLIEAIMTAYAQDRASTEKIVQAVKVIGPFNASEDLPIDYEDALLVWMNKVAVAYFKSSAVTKYRDAKKATSVRLTHSQAGDTLPAVPVMEDILKDISDGCNLCTIISFYCPHILNYTDIQLGNHVGIGDSIHNLSLVKAFCDRYLPVRVYHFTHEDILYSTHTIKPSLLAFLSQLFQYFVIKPLDIVNPVAHLKPVISNQVLRVAAIPPSKASQHQSAGRGELISNATKQSFHNPHSPTTTSQRLSRNSDHYGSNPSLNSSSASAIGHSSSSSRLLHKRSIHPDSPATGTSASRDGENMHDTLSPIVVRKSQSMGILNSPDPKQSMVAWESKSYFVDRSKNNDANRPYNGSQSLLSNVSFDEGPEDEEGATPLTDSTQSLNSARNSQRNHGSGYLSNRGSNNRSLTDRSKPEMSNTYQKLLDRSNDLESPLKLFAQKHGFQLAQSDAASSGDQLQEDKSPSPVDMTVTELTKVTPRSDSSTSPRQHIDSDRNGAVSVTGQSYVISTALNPDSAQAAGIPVIPDTGVSDSVTTDITFTSFAEGRGDDDGRDSPIEPIFLSPRTTDNTEGDIGRISVTSFADLSKHRSPYAGGSTQESINMNNETQNSGLKQRFEQSKQGPDGKPAKKTTFSLNQTTWSDHASRTRHSSGGTESDTQSESSEASSERKQFTDVKILLEEKRKTMEKKKKLEEIERTKEMNAASQKAFLTAVSRNKTSNPNHDRNGNDALKAFSRGDISKSIENLQNKWQKEESKNAKRAAATTAAKNINVTQAASLDNITEVSERGEVETPKVPLPSATGAVKPTTPERNNKVSDVTASDLHETPVELEQFGLEKLNESLSELRGEMKRLSDEQKRIEELQTVMHSVQPTSRSTPRSKSAAATTAQSNQTLPLENPSAVGSLDSKTSTRQTDHTLRLSDLNHKPSTSSEENAAISQSYHEQINDNFSQPNIHAMSQSTDQPFMLHQTPPRKVDNMRTSNQKAAAAQCEPMAVSSPKATPKSESPMKRSNSNGFLSSSQLSRKKASRSEPQTEPHAVSASPVVRQSQPAQPSPADQSLLDQSAGRKRWGSNSGPLFPGYEEDTPVRSKVREPEAVTQDQQPLFRPPSDPESTNPRRRSSNKPFHQNQSPLDTPLREPQFEVKQLPGRKIPSELSLEDTPMREALSAQGLGSSMPGYSIDDTPLRTGQTSHAQSLASQIPDHLMDDTPMRDAYQQRMQHSVDNSGHNSWSNTSGIMPHDLSMDTPMRMPPHMVQSSHNISIDTPMRLQQHTEGYSDHSGSPHRQQSIDDTPVRLAAALHGRQRPQSMIETGNLDYSIDTPMRGEAMRSNNQIFYSPPTKQRLESAERDMSPSPSQSDISHSFTDTPIRQAQAVSRHGTTTIPPQVTSRHGVSPANQPLDLSDSKPRYVTAPYEFQQPEPEKPINKPAYKLTTPYGTAQNELSPGQTNISLSNAMDAIRTDMIRQHNQADPLASNQPFGLASPPADIPAPSDVRRVSSDVDHTMPDVGYRQTAATSPAASSVNSMVTSVSAQGDGPMMRQASIDNEDKVSVHSHSSGSGESDGTPRSGGRPKRATWDMSTPRGDLLNQPGVGFIVAEQSQTTEEELRKRKEKVLMMQMKRKEENEQKKQQKAAELAAKAEQARRKEMEAERKKTEDKAKKEAILHEYQYRKAEEDLPPEMRAHFRQKQKRTGERPASIHWAGTSHDEASLRASDNMDAASSFTVSLGPAGNLSHRRPASPASSVATGSMSSRSKAPSRGPIEAPPQEYTGPKLYVQPSQKQKSNRHIIINAISHCCLAGVVNTDNKNKVLEGIAKSDGKHFLILFRDGNQTYKATYTLCPDSEVCTKIHGQGPKHIKDDMCHRFYKYNSGGKKFTEVLSTKHLSVSIDAITIHNHLWQKKPASSSTRR